MGNFLSPLKSRAKNVSTFLSTQKSALTLKSPFLSGSTLTSALLGTLRRALSPPEPTSENFNTAVDMMRIEISFG